MGRKKIVETFIKTYDNAIPHVLCDMLIEKFDTNTDQWENRDKRTEDRGNLKFNEVHLFKYMERNREDGYRCWVQCCSTILEKPCICWCIGS